MGKLNKEDIDEEAVEKICSLNFAALWKPIMSKAIMDKMKQQGGGGEKGTAGAAAAAAGGEDVEMAGGDQALISAGSYLYQGIPISDTGSLPRELVLSFLLSGRRNDVHVAYRLICNANLSQGGRKGEEEISLS